MRETGSSVYDMAERMTPEQFVIICDAIIDDDIRQKIARKRSGDRSSKIVSGDEFLGEFGK